MKEFIVQQFSISNLLEILAQILFVAGLWKVFVKCGEKGWWALIPGFKYYKLGECARRETEGKVCVVLEIAGGTCWS